LAVVQSRALPVISAQGGGHVKQRYMLSVMCARSTYKLTWEEIVRLYRLTLDQPARNLGDVGRDPPRFVFGEYLRRRSSGFILAAGSGAQA
jgi:hypothetical protein